MDKIYVLAEQIYRCKKCKGDCSKCAKLQVIKSALNSMSAVEQLDVDNAVYIMEEDDARRAAALKALDAASEERWKTSLIAMIVMIVLFGGVPFLLWIIFTH